MSQSNKTAKSALTIIIFALGSKFLGFLREVIIAAKFGSGMETDTFFYSFISFKSDRKFLKSCYKYNIYSSYFRSRI